MYRKKSLKISSKKMALSYQEKKKVS